VTNEYRRQPGALFVRGPMPVGPAPILDRGQRAGKTALGRGLPHHVLAIPRLSPRVGEAEEVERWILAVWGRPTTSLRAEVDEARLVRMQLEAEPAKPFPQHVHNPLGIVVGLESHHEIISEPYQGRLPPHAWSHHVLEPLIQHMVQENIREHW
jgi:hypothetical protein